MLKYEYTFEFTLILRIFRHFNIIKIVTHLEVTLQNVKQPKNGRNSGPCPKFGHLRYRIPFGRSAAENEGKIKTDTLQRLHSVSNLAELLEAGHQGIPPTLRDSSLRYTAGGGAPGHPTHSQGLLPKVHCWRRGTRASHPLSWTPPSGTLLEAGHQGIPPTLRDSSLRYTAGGGAPGHPTHSQGLLPQVHPENQ